MRATAAGAASPARTATAARTSATAARAEPRIRPRIDEQAIEEQVDRLRHDLDGVERAVVERVAAPWIIVSAVGTFAA